MGSKVQVLLAALIAWPVAAQEYTPTLIPAELLGSPQTMTPLYGGDDSTHVVQFAFPFQYYGQTFTSAWVSSNGFVSFQSGNHLCCDGLPMDQAQRNTIYGYWTDLIGGANPYYKSTETSILFGWYGTNEYGTQNKNTFEINLSASGGIQFNYGAVSNTWHMVSAGITGPTEADNIQLFYGQSVQNLSFQSGLLSPATPEPPPPEPPQPEPVPVPAALDPAPDVVPDPTAPVEVLQNEPEVAVAQEVSVVEEAATSDDVVVSQQVDENQPEDANDSPLSPDQLQALSAIEVTSEPTEQDVQQATEAVAEEAQAAEAARVEQQSPEQTTSVSSETRRDRNVEFFQSEAIGDADTFVRETVLNASLQNVAFIAQADAQYTEMHGEQTTTETVDTTYGIEPQQGPTFPTAQMTGMATPDETVWTDGKPDNQDVAHGASPMQQEATQTPDAVPTDAPARSEPVTTAAIDTSPAGQAQQMELLGMQAEMASGPVVDVGDVNNGDSETMSQLAAIPAGYSSYTQARIPDAPFYQPKDIYKGRRIPDANMALFRMMRGQDQRWQEMVDEQYE